MLGRRVHRSLPRTRKVLGCRKSRLNLVEEMRFSSALDGVTVSDPGFVDVSMIEEVYAVTKRKANCSGPESDASDARVAEKDVQNVQPGSGQPAVRVVAEAVVEVPVAGHSSTQAVPVAGHSSIQAVPIAGPSLTQEVPVTGPSSILERPRAAVYSRKQPVADSSCQTKLVRKEPAPACVIRMMVGKPEFDFVASLRDTALAGLTWGDVLVLAPREKRDVVRQLVQGRTRKSSGKQKVQRPVSFVQDVKECCHVEASRQVAWPTAMGIGRALAEDPATVTNFYTIGNINLASRGDAEVTVYSIGKILVDSGSVLNLIPEYLARHLNLRLSPTKSLMMRTAAAEVSIIRWYVDLDIEVAGVTATSRVYCIPAPARPSYTLLLGRKWMKQVRAVGNFETGTYVVRDSLGNTHIVTAQAAPASIRTEVPILIISHDWNAAAPDGLDEVNDDLDEETRLELALGPDGYADALLRQVEEEAEEEMQAQGGAADADGYAGDSEESNKDDGIYVNEGGSGNVQRR
jgi:hypothetical protein